MRWVALVAASIGCGSCAKFPSSGANTNYTRVHFRMRVAGKINTSQDDDPLTNYLYFVAIRASAEDNPDPTTNPQPVFSASPNGFVSGQPTHFVQFDTLNPTQQYPYRLYKFATSTDPSNPINLSSWSEVSQRIINFTAPSTNGNELNFDLFINQLDDTVDGAKALKYLQVNFLTMNKTSIQSTSGRLIDFLGNNNNVTELNKAIRVDLRSSNSYSNTSDYEPQGDTADPDLDIVDWSVQVTPP